MTRIAALSLATSSRESTQRSRSANARRKPGLAKANGGLIINSLIQSKLPYDPFRDFTPISRLVINPQILVLTASVPASSVKELVALLKARPGALNYASVGQGSTTHLSMELFKSMTGTDAVHVPYKGGAPALHDLLTSQVQLMFSNMPAVLPHVKAGRLKGLAVGSARRARHTDRSRSGRRRLRVRLVVRIVRARETAAGGRDDTQQARRRCAQRPISSPAPDGRRRRARPQHPGRAARSHAQRSRAVEERGADGEVEGGMRCGNTAGPVPCRMTSCPAR